MTLSAPEVDRLFRALVPLRIDLSNEKDGTRTIDIESLKHVELIPEEGVRIVGAARVTWPLGGFNLPVTLDEASVKLVLSSGVKGETGGRALQLRIVIELADVPMLPEFAEASIIKRINEALASSGPLLDLDLEALVRRHIDLPRAVLPKTALLTRLSDLHVSVTTSALTVTGTVSGEFEREPIGPFAAPENHGKGSTIAT